MQYKIEEKQAFYVLEKVETHSVENEQNQTSVPAFWSRASEDGTIDKLDLKRPVFKQTAVGGHFGKDFLAWELTDKAEELAKFIR